MPSFVLTLKVARQNTAFWGRVVESAIGAHLVNAAAAGLCEVLYWRDRNREVDFVVTVGKALTAIEVKCGRSPLRLPGMEAFANSYKPKRMLLVGGDGIPIEEFLSKPVEHWMSAAS